MPNYPAQIDNSTSLPKVVDNLTPVQASVFNPLRDAVISIESVLGTSPNGIYSTVAGRLTSLENLINGTPFIELTQDLGGTVENPLVIGLQGRPLSNAPPTTGQVLSWNGIAWVPAATTSISVLWNNDLISSNALHQYVSSISGTNGNGGTVSLNVNNLQFGIGQTSPTISQATKTTDVAANNLILAPQGAFSGASTHQTPGSLVLALGTPVNGNHGGFIIQDSGVPWFQFAPITVAGTEYAAAWFAQPSPNVNNYNLVSGASIGLEFYHPVEVGIFTGTGESSGVIVAPGSSGGTFLYSQNFVNNPSPGASVIVQDKYFAYTAFDSTTGYKLIEAGLQSGGLFTAFNNGTLNSVAVGANNGNGTSIFINAITAPTVAMTNAFQFYGAGGNAVIAPGNPSVGTNTTPTLFVAENGSTNFAALQANTSISGYAALYLGSAFANSPTSTNEVMAMQNTTGDLYIQSPNVNGSYMYLLADGYAKIFADTGASVQLLSAPNSSTSPSLLIEAGYNIAHSCAFTALNQVSPNTGLSSTQLGTAPGSGVTWIGNAQTNPTAAPTGGTFLYADGSNGGALTIYQPNGLHFAINPGTSTVTNVTTNYTTGSGDQVILVGSINSSITITLQTSPTNGKTLIIKDAQGSTNGVVNVTINPAGGNTVDGHTTPIVFSAAYSSVSLVFNSGNWSIV